MKKAKRILALLLSLLMCSSLLVACKKDDTPEGEEPTDPGTESTAPAEEMVQLADATSAVEIRYPMGGGTTMETAAKSLANAIKNKVGSSPKTGQDELTKYDEHDSTTVQILIGETSYSESINEMKATGYGEWRVLFSGNKLLVLSHSDSGIITAVTELTRYVNANTPDGSTTVSVPKSLKLSGEVDSTLNAIPVVDSNNLKTIYESGNGSWTVIVRPLPASERVSYLQKVEASGYTKYTSNDIDGNLFDTYHRQDGKQLTVMYTPHDKTLCLVADPMTESAPAGKPEENVYDKTTTYDTTLTQVGLCYDLPEGIEWNQVWDGTFADYTGGLLHIFRLEDGSFLIIDSGHGRDSNGDLIYNVLREQAPDPDNIVIAAWILSHSHGDHVGGMVNFAPRYKDKVTVERFIYNYPNHGLAGSGGSGGAESAARRCFPDAKWTKAHAGEKYYIRNAVVEMLYSFELLAPYDMSWFNESSLVFSVEAEGIKTTYLTDIGPLGNDLICDMYGDYEDGEECVLKSDFIQVAHHGWDGGSYLLNQLIDPDYVLFNGTTGPQDKNGNDYFWKKESGSYVKQEWITEIYRAKWGIQLFTLNDGAFTYRSYDTHEAYYNAQ